MEEDELLDLVNANDEVVGTVMRETYHANPPEYTRQGQFWRGTACVLVNSNGEIWIPKRQPNRKVAPNGLDFSMAEHVQSGESHLQGAIRGMEEELNLKLQPEDIHLIGKRVFKKFGAVMSLYIYRTDENPDYSKKDYQRAWWMSIDELRGKIKDGVKCKDALPFWLDDLERVINE